MLINDLNQYVKSNFESETEIEHVVQKYAEQLFGSSILYLSQTKISTIGGKGTVPDAIVIDVQSEEWFVVEVERAVHGTWDHIAPQISKQLAAVNSSETRELIIQLALSQIGENKELLGIFAELGIGELEIHGKLQQILRQAPSIAIPIDGIPKDLKDWIQTLRNNVKVWVIEKFVSTTTPNCILYSLPDENLPTLATTSVPGAGISTVRSIGSQPYQELLNANLLTEGTTLILEYGPRGKKKQTFRGVVRKEGIEVDGKVYSPSYAAVYCIQKAGSNRTTANGWIMWKTLEGQYLTDLYQHLDETESSASE